MLGGDFFRFFDRPPNRYRAPDLPPELAAIVDCSLARKPEIRFPSAEAMRQALLTFTEK